MAASLEALSAGAIYLMLGALDDPSVLRILGLPAAWIPTQRRSLLIVGTACIAALYALKTVILIADVRLANRRRAESAGDLSVRLLRSYLAAPFAFHLRRNSADLLYTTMRATNTVYREVVPSLMAILAEVLVLLGLAVVLLMTSPASSLAAVAVTLAFLAGLNRFLRGTFEELGTELERADGAAQRGLLQAVEGIKEVRLRGRESFVAERFANERRRALAVERRFLNLSATSRLLLETVFVFGMLAVVLVLGWKDSAAAGLVPVLAVYAYAGFRVIPSANRLQMHLALVRHGMSAVDRVLADLQAAEEAGRAAGSERRGPPISFEKRISLEGIAYAYDSGSPAVLRGVDLEIGRGESVGIIGSTGAGKTTLLHIVLGFLAPSSGRVLVDGRDIRDDLGGWQTRIGYVPQSLHLIDDTLLRNVAFCLPDQSIEIHRVREALHLAQLDAFVEAQPGGLHVVLGERGLRLSGGERQRVAIARALYDDPDVLVFDEGTSSLDPATEKELTQAIEGLHGRKTLIVVAHRLATVRGCDRIVLLEGGRIAATGTFEELERNHAGFRRLAAT